MGRIRSALEEGGEVGLGVVGVGVEGVVVLGSGEAGSKSDDEVAASTEAEISEEGSERLMAGTEEPSSVGGRGVRRRVSSSTAGSGGEAGRDEVRELLGRATASFISTSVGRPLLAVESVEVSFLSGTGGSSLNRSTTILCKLTKMASLARGEREDGS